MHRGFKKVVVAASAAVVAVSGGLFVGGTAASASPATAYGPQKTLIGLGLFNPDGVAVAAGSVYITDTGNGRVMKRSSAGVRSTLPFTGLRKPEGVAVDSAGN